jgi:hypothetical protein
MQDASVYIPGAELSKTRELNHSNQHITHFLCAFLKVHFIKAHLG